MITAESLPRISIITPSYNQGQYIEDTILSVINQDYPDLEYIVIDGGSTDNTVDIIKKYSDRLTYWISEKDTGQANAINKGFRKATGEIINWINSDDQLMPGALIKIADYFTKNPDVMLVHGRIKYFGDISNYYSKNYSKKNLEIRYVSHICMPQPSCFYRKQLIDEQGLLDESLHFSMDADLFIRAGLHYKLLQVEDVLSRFRLHNESKSVSTFNKIFLSDNAIIFSRVLITLGYSREIEEMKYLGLYKEPTYLYNKPAKHFNARKMIYFFLAHRLSTLYFQGDRKGFKKIFSHLLKYHIGLLIKSPKLLLYRSLLFLPSSISNKIFKSLFISFKT